MKIKIVLPDDPQSVLLSDLPDELQPGRLDDLPDGGKGWTPVYDLDQADPQADSQPGVKFSMCGDCAYRPRSPERQGDDRYKGDAEFLDRIVRDGHPFWCHQGMRRPVAFRNEGDGIEIPAHPGSYDPPIRGALPYKADGTVADLCAGWVLRRARHVDQAGAR